MTSENTMKGKSVIVTGGASGIGKSMVELFAAKGAHVSILDMNDEGKNLASTVNQNGGSAEYYHCDVSEAEGVNATFSEVTKSRDLNILVNNAGIGFVGNIEQTQEEDLDRLYNVNVKGVFHCAKAAVGYLKGKGGVILNVASIASVVAVADRFAYSMTKGAVFTMTQSIAKDYLSEGVRCNCIAPARVHTPFVDGFIAKNYPGKEAEMFEKLSKSQPIGRMAKPAEVAALALYLCSDEAAFITGNCYPIDGGFINLNS